MALIEYQRIILADSVRNDAFARALKKVIVKGKSVVADIGSGTGFLSFLAAGLGAKECVLYEQSELLELSRALAKENGIRNCRFVRAHSTEVPAPAKADIVMSETLGNFALEENILETMNDAQRFLKPGGALIPQGLTQYVAPIVTETLRKEVTSWDRTGHAVTFDAAKEFSLNNVYVRTVKTADILSQENAVQEWDAIDFRKKNKSVRSSVIEWKIDRAVTVYGFALWWEALLVPGVTLSTGPASPRTHWEQIYLPVAEPIDLKSADTLSLTIRSDSRYEVKINVAWEVAVRSKSGHKNTPQRFDMRRGYVE